MNIKLVSKIFFPFVCIFAFASVNAAQEKPQAILVGEYEYTDDISAFERMTERLIFRLAQEPATTSGLIDINDKGDLSERVKAILLKHPKLKNKILYGFSEKVFRPELRANFWLIPLGAETPDLGCRIPVCVCPTLSISNVKLFDTSADNLIFTASVEGGSESEIKYTWKISAGKFVEGQGTTAIKVDPEGAKEITATLEIEGICDECPRETSFTTKIQQ